MKTLLKILGGVVGTVVALVLVLFVAASVNLSLHRNRTYAIPVDKLTLPVAKADLAQGKHLVTVRMACVECHGADLGGGVLMDDAIVGHVYGGNLTPAVLKDWTDEEIARSIRHGVSRAGHPYLIMPSQDYRNMAQEDMVAIIRYLRSVPAVDRPTRPSSFGPLLKILFMLGKAPTAIPAEIIDHHKPFPPAVKEGVTVEFGRYVVNNTCVGCHGDALKGGPIVGGPPDWVPAANLTLDSLGDWTEAGFIKTLRTGVNPSGSTLRLPMTLMLKYAKFYSDTELKAVWKYLRTVKGAKDTSGF